MWRLTYTKGSVNTVSFYNHCRTDVYIPVTGTYVVSVRQGLLRISGSWITVAWGWGRVSCALGRPLSVRGKGSSSGYMGRAHSCCASPVQHSSRHPSPGSTGLSSNGSEPTQWLTLMGYTSSNAKASAVDKKVPEKEEPKP